MNKRIRNMIIALCIAFCSLPISDGVAKSRKLHWSKTLSSGEQACRDELILSGNLADPGTKEFRVLQAAARVARSDLNGDGRSEYFYLFEDSGWCGSAGCALIVAEGGTRGNCRPLFNGYGWFSTEVLRASDHGYRRLYLPCEARFDGRRYQQVHAECPTVDVQR